jgi:uncharacterized protein with HEPN domain
MRLEVKKYLFDIEQAARLLTSFVQGKSLDDYLADPLLRSGIERQFEIVGEATNQLAKVDPKCAQRITDYQKLIAFRNVLIHGYAEVDDHLVWDLLQTRLPELMENVTALKSET